MNSPLVTEVGAISLVSRETDTEKDTDMERHKNRHKDTHKERRKERHKDRHKERKRAIWQERLKTSKAVLHHSATHISDVVFDYSCLPHKDFDAFKLWGIQNLVETSCFTETDAKQKDSQLHNIHYMLLLTIKTIYFLKSYHLVMTMTKTNTYKKTKTQIHITQTLTKTKPNTKCFQDPMYTIFF